MRYVTQQARHGPPPGGSGPQGGTRELPIGQEAFSRQLSAISKYLARISHGKIEKGCRFMA